jgi:uncharacterized protein
MYIFAIYMKEQLQQCSGFEWDEVNTDKNWIRHQVNRSECEQVFFNEPLAVADDEHHSEEEQRWYILGHTDPGRLLFVMFTLSNKLIRVISARDINKKERRIIMSNKTKIPAFKNEEEEREFWANTDATEYVDWKKAEKIKFKNLKPSTKMISLRLPEFILDELKLLANKRDVPYQSLIKMYLKERIDKELKQSL